MIPTIKQAAGGFTLIETLVAVMLLASAIAGPLTIASKGLNASRIAKDQVSAFYLAQDAVEYVRYVRDSNKLTGATWLTGLTACSSTDGSATCYLDSTNNDPATPTACSASGCPTLKYDSSLSRFTYTSGTPTSERYVRTVKITTPVSTNADEAAVEVKVTWLSAGISHTVVVRENILNW